ncbi:autotransporter outer membrane beta-barrel domain-containing protein [Roseomonas cutis]|uniref:autotransporter outer membrane beta-barrel domain-containing protein n=1 Tax=Roseomonas cutis TaxID=2897332 RepID=UPI00210269B7|nr:autotransporter outer membrane beta-barrel domain-containing protein [Roseomonas sp. OT10]
MSPGASSRARLLSSCSGTAVLAASIAGPLVLFSAALGGAARADDCTPQGGYACYYVVQPPTAPNGPNNGSPGSPGTAVGAAGVNIPGVAYPAGEAIVIRTIGGQGGAGRNSHYSEMDKNGGDGGRGGDGNTLTVTMQPGTTTGEITLIEANGGAGGVSGHGSHGGANGTGGDGGTAGTVVAGTSNAPMVGQLRNPAAAQAPISGLVPSVGLYAGANGGAGAAGVNFDNASPDTSVDDGGDGGNGGNSSGGVSVVFQGGVTGTQGGILARSQGGNGGNGGLPINVDFPVGASGGDGGNGGTGGSVSVMLMPGSSASSTGTGAAITAQSFGGQGGQGGAGLGDASGGTAGSGADAGSVSVVNYGAASTGSADSPGILAQSFGGAGGGGGQGGGWGAGGGNGGTGGSGGPIGFVAAAVSSVATSGSNSPGVLLQSIGGGGGNGGDSNGWLAVGGDGAAPGNGGDITVFKSTDASGASAITTSGERSTGILAQSIGGGGGNGGNATGTGKTDAFLNIVIGGSGAGGGHGGTVQAATTGSIATSGLHSSGIVLQSIGGGGGNGGAAYSKVVSVIGGASVSVGGSGGGGGNGGTVGQITDTNTGGLFPTSTGQILTTGANSHGIIGQSIGGGGGIGGASGATATVYGAATEEVPTPTVSVAVAIGGAGGAGGNGGSVSLQNTGLIATAGGGSIGIAGQSVGGGGGSGGDASATSTAKGNDDSPLNVSTSVALGGTGGGGGTGGPASVTNGGMIFTRGEAADAVLAQSIGGGGGNGGTGDAKAKSSGDGANISASVSLGGAGGSGNNGGPVTVDNSGAILTLGDGAMGVLAQSVGGGGGRGGGAAGTSNGQFTANVAVGGNGGGGGSTTQPNGGNAVTVTNAGTIVTFGADAPAVVAQSVGGGGGFGGKSASTLGNHTNSGDGGNGASGSVNGAMTSLNSAFAAGGEGAVNQYNSVSGLIGVANSALGNVTATRLLGDDPTGDLEDLGESGGDSGDGSSSTKITVHVNVGGQGGAAGDAGNIHVTNTGSIGTVGPMSDGILAQAIGGGGGRGGAAVSSITSGQVNEDDKEGNVPISVGGQGGHGGSAGSVTVDNGGNVTTIGAQSLGIVAQSIAGGGGIAGTSAAKVKGDNADNTSVLSLPIAIGANGGGGGSAGTVTVTNAGAIVTRSHDATGIVAQSIAGGGGIVRTRSSDASDNNGGGPVATGGSYGINLTFGGNCGTLCDASKEAPAGSAGSIAVNHTGSITTGSVAANGTRFGSNAYGILAQSIGGGGGLVLGGTPNGTNFFGSGTMTGDAGSVTVSVGNASGAAGSAGNITTYGLGAVAILAQSIGGGGGLAGDTGLTAQRAGFAPSSAHSGNGGQVLINVNPTAILSTSADNTPVILAQSIGGGGGRVTSSGDGAYDGTAGGSGTGGAVTMNVYGQVRAGGAASPGIFAESVGQGSTANPTGGAAVRINVGPGALVQGGRDFNPGDGYNAGIYIVGGSTNQDPSSQTNNNINNQGTITSLGTTAIYGTGGWTSVYNQAGGTITGSVNLDNGNGGGACPQGGCAVTGGNVANAAGAAFNTGPLVRLGAAGTLTNAGTLNIGGTGTIATTAMTGNLVQTGSGRLVVDTNHATGQADRLDVQGSASLAGTVEVHAASLANRAVTVLTATQGVSLDAGLATTRTQLFRFDAQASGNSLLIQPRAEFATQAAGLGQNQQRVAAHLQELWDSGASLGTGYTALAGVADAGGYARTLNSLSGQTVGAVAAFRYSASQSFVTTMLDGCPTYEQAGITDAEQGCGWARILGRHSDQDATAAALGYTADAWTMQTGGQVQVAPGWFLGGSIAYESSDFRGDGGLAKVNGDSLLLGATLRHQDGPWQISGALDFGYGWYDSKRTVEVGTLTQQASASPRAWQVGAHARVAYQIPFEGWYLQPRVDLHLNHVRSGSYTESGASPFNLTVDGQGETSVAATPAIEVGGRIRIAEGMVLRPYASAGLSLVSNGDWAATARFAGQPASRGFRATTPIPDTLGKFALGAELLSTGNWDFKLQYSADLGDRYASHAGMARVAYRF